MILRQTNLPPGRRMAERQRMPLPHHSRSLCPSLFRNRLPAPTIPLDRIKPRRLRELRETRESRQSHLSRLARRIRATPARRGTEEDEVSSDQPRKYPGRGSPGAGLFCLGWPERQRHPENPREVDERVCPSQVMIYIITCMTAHTTINTIH